ncbi:MAG TPA: carbohydrate-binding family 9-like protein [bacterium]|nr:carbohydrate-binding family 9-like protein [bacterium]HPP29965.1 carbohydrate-binding family 9-like protein [bacterium]
MNNKIWMGMVLSIILVSGCALTPGVSTGGKTPAGTVPLIAKFSKSPVVIDGKLDDPVWKISPAYNLSLAKSNLLPLAKRQDKREGIDILRDEGIAQLAWDENYLYIGIKFYDSDIVQEGTEDQKHFYGTGDLVEIFLKPEGNTWYWEIYGTPNEKKTVFWFPGRGRIGIPSSFQPGMELQDILVAAQVKGTLNDWKDRDEYWTLEMAIPVKGLTQYGDAFGPGSKWRILIARYNYSRYNPWTELSTAPQLSIANFHLLEGYGALIFER